jgi:hypothetical protein
MWFAVMLWGMIVRTGDRKMMNQKRMSMIAYPGTCGSPRGSDQDDESENVHQMTEFLELDSVEMTISFAARHVNWLEWCPLASDLINLSIQLRLR